MKNLLSHSIWQLYRAPFGCKKRVARHDSNDYPSSRFAFFAKKYLRFAPKHSVTIGSVRGFTLVELLVSVALFTGILGTMFSVLAALRKSEQFRDDTIVATQAAGFAYEPMVRALKTADATETFFEPISGECRTVRGFYLLDPNGTFQPNVELPNLNPGAFTLNQHKLAVIDTEQVHTSGAGPQFRWVKREYRLSLNDQDEKGVFHPTITESVYDPLPTFAWPIPLSCVANNLHWQQTPREVRKLTSNKAQITRFAVRGASPLINPTNRGLLNAPFITLEVTATNTKPNPAAYTLRSTITPTFTYGEQRD